MADLVDDGIVAIKEEDDGTKQIVKLSDTLNLVQEDLSLLEARCDQEYSRVSAPASENEEPETSNLQIADSITVYVCPQCDKETFSKTDLRHHLKVHTTGIGQNDATKMEQDSLTQDETVQCQNGAIEEQQHAAPEQQLVSQKGRGMFTRDGYSYVFDRFSGDREKKFWRCERKGKGHLCKARLHTDSNNAVLKQINDHNHEPNAAKIEATIMVRTAVKALSAVVREALPSELINAAKQNLTPAAAGHFPATASLCKVVSRARRVRAASAASARLADLVSPDNYGAYEVQPGEAVNYAIADNDHELTDCEVDLEDYHAIVLDQSTSSDTSQRGSFNSDRATIMTEHPNDIAINKPAGKRKASSESPGATICSNNSKASKPSDVKKMINISDTTNGAVEEDPDELFLKSLLPEIKRMTDKQKLLFKMRMIKFIAETAYDEQDALDF